MKTNTETNSVSSDAAHAAVCAPRLSEKRLAANRSCYIAEAGLEYLISLLITDSFLARLLTSNGVSDSAAGIVTELASFAFSAQIVSVFFRKRSGMKRFITLLHLANQIMFVLLYFVPVFNIPSGVKAPLIALMFLGGHVIANIVSPYKISWFMSYVPDKSRGKFTANKEIVSLACGTVFSLIMGSVSDYYKSVGNDEAYFTVCAAAILVLAVLHMLSILLVRESENSTAADDTYHIGFSEALKKTFSDRMLIKIIFIDVIWQFSSKLSIAYYGVYKNNELGFSMKYVALLSVLSAVSRISFSRFFGKLADRYSWLSMLKICFGVAACAFFINIFTVPSNGKWMFAAYSCIYAVSMAGINSGLMNVIFDYTIPEDRAPSLGIKSALGGISGFLSSFLGGYIVHTVQSGGNKIGGLTVYGQQILSAITFTLCIVLIIYVTFILGKGKNKSEHKK